MCVSTLNILLRSNIIYRLPKTHFYRLSTSLRSDIVSSHKTIPTRTSYFNQTSSMHNFPCSRTNSDVLTRVVNKNIFNASNIYISRQQSTSPNNGWLCTEKETIVVQEELTSKQKLKKFIKEYGSVVLVFHITMSLSMLGMVYALVSSGVDLMALMKKLGAPDSLLSNQIVKGGGTFVVSYAIYKVFSPLRMAITFTVTPFIVRHLRKIGFLKPK